MRKWLFLLLINLIYAYSDLELERLWSSLSDLNCPSLEDYQSIERYLHEGERPYFDVLHRSILTLPESLKGTGHWRLSLMRNLKLVGPSGEMPIFEVHKINVTERTQDRCILLFGSYNRLYADKARSIVAELKECGYSGHVLLRLGGFPNTPNGGIKICHVPYSFKVAFLREAQILGYKQVLWLDTAMHPLTDLEMIFAEIKKRGYFFTWVGTLKENAPFHLEEASSALNLPMHLHSQVPHIASALLGLNMENSLAVEFLDDWYGETEKTYPNITWFPEELSLAATAWRLGCQPYSWFGDIACSESEVFELFQLQQRPNLQFYLDGKR